MNKLGKPVDNHIYRRVTCFGLGEMGDEIHPDALPRSAWDRQRRQQPRFLSVRGFVSAAHLAVLYIL